MFGSSVGVRTGWIASAVILTVFLATLLLVAQATFSIMSLVAIFLGALVVILAGECVLRLARLDQIAGRPIAALVLGAIVTALALTCGVFLTAQTAGGVLLAWALFVVAVALAVRPWAAPAAATASIDLVALGCIALTLLLWCYKAAGAVPTLEAEGMLPLWIDYYIHGAITASFGDPLAAGRGDISLVGVPVVFYHFSFYQLAAAVQSATGASGLSIATSILLPLGLLLGAGGAYVLASELADRRAGVLALAMLLLMPDASHYWLANGFFGFYWHLFATPGAGYGLAVAALILTALSQWFRNSDPRSLALCGALMLALIQFRAHFFIWLAPAVVGTLLLATPVARKHWRVLSAGSAVLLVVLIAAVAVYEPLQRLWLSHSAILDYLHLSHTHSAPNGYTGLYVHMKESLGRIGAIFAGTFLLLPVMLGLFIVLYPLTLAYALRTRGFKPLDAFPPLLVATAIVVTLLAPHDAGGHISEYQHRAFVLLYMVVAVWTSAYLVEAMGSTSRAQPYQIGLGLAGIAAAAAALSLGAGIAPSTPRFAWSKNFYNAKIDPDVLTISRKIRHAARHGDTIAVGPINPEAELVDQAMQVASLTDIPVFLARPKNQLIEGERHRSTATRRLKVLQSIEKSRELTQVLDLMRTSDIDWYVWLGKTPPPFDPDRAHADFAAGNAAVYHLGARTSDNAR